MCSVFRNSVTDSGHMAELHFDHAGIFAYDRDADEHRSGPLAVPMLECDDAEIVLVGYLDDSVKQEFHDVVRNLLSSTRDTLLAASPDLQRYCSDINQFLEPEDELHVDDPYELWNHVRLGRTIYVERRHYGDRKLYATIECGCDWEPEHGLQIVFREGLRVTKLGPYDGHFTNSDAYDDPSLESVVYRSVH